MFGQDKGEEERREREINRNIRGHGLHMHKVGWTLVLRECKCGVVYVPRKAASFRHENEGEGDDIGMRK